MTRRLRCSLLLGTDLGAERPDDVGAHLRRYAQAAEAAGFDGIYVPTDIGTDRPHPLGLATALGAWTERITVGTCTLAAPLVDPLALAEAALTAQVVTRGRLMLGISLGWNVTDFAAAGVAVSRRRQRLDEHLSVLPRLMAGEPVNHDGREFQVRTGPLALAADAGLPPPIWLGAHGKAGIVRAAKFGRWIAGPFTSMDQLSHQLTAIPNDCAPPEIALMRECVVFTSSSDERRKGEIFRQKYLEYQRRVGGMAFDADNTPAEIARDRVIYGSPDTCRAEARRFATATGASELILRTTFRGIPPQQAIEDVELLGQELLPHLREDQ